jgi:chromosome segregation ATPase
MKGVVALSCVLGVVAGKVSPVEKVIEMIEGLQSKVVAEGSAEAKTYDTFACFCKDQSKEKNAAIEDNTNLLESLNAKMTTERSNRDKETQTIKDLQGELAGYQADVKKTKADAAKRKEKYEVNITDLTGAVRSLEDAIDVLKQSDKSENGMALVSMKATLKTAAVIAQSLGLVSGRKMLMQLGDIPEVPTSDYDFHSNDIIDTLKELLSEFRKEKEAVDAAEVKAHSETTSELQGLADSIKATEVSLEDAKSALAAAEEAIGSLSGDMTTATATLNDDQNYLKDLTDKCNKKKELWDQRSTMRQDELSALTGALEALKGTVSENTTDKTIRLAQTSFVQVASKDRKVAKHHVMLNKAASSTRGFLSARDPRQIVMELLRSKSVTLKSAILASLASKAGKDPLGKVKQMIEDLILKLQNEASEEEEEHGYCTKETKLSEDKRDMSAKDIKKLNGRLGSSEAKRDKLTENIATLEGEISELEAALKEQTEIREAEKKENQETVKDAEEGTEGVNMAIDILNKFYKTAAKDVPSFVQRKQGPTADDMPDAGFDAEYGASQDDSVGVLGMLDVIKSDFSRTISETKKTEEEQADAFLEFSTTTKSSLAEKNNAVENYSTELTATKDSISADTESMTQAQEKFDAAINSLSALYDRCVDTGMSYEERVARREDEVEALKEAYNILDGYTPE